MRRFADTLVAYLIIVVVGLKSAIFWTDGEVNPPVGKIYLRRAPGLA